MKRSIIIALALALALGTTAIAEVADTARDEEVTAAMEETNPIEAPEESSEATQRPTDAPAEAAPADDANALNDALKALRDARGAVQADALKAELDDYVAAGKLTQEQADLILKNLQERQAGKQNGIQGGKGRFGGKQRGQMGKKSVNDQQTPRQGQQPRTPGNGQQPWTPDANSGATPQAPGNGPFGGQMPGNHR